MSKRNRTNLSNLLKKLREERGLTLEEASQSIGCDKAFLSGCETGRYPFPFKRLAAAEKIFKPSRVTIKASAIYAAMIADIEESQE